MRLILQLRATQNISQSPLCNDLDRFVDSSLIPSCHPHQDLRSRQWRDAKHSEKEDQKVRRRQAATNAAGTLRNSKRL